MSPTIFVEDEAGQLLPLSQQEYEAETVLQELLSRYPGLLASEGDEEDRRYLLVRREMGVPSKEGGSDHWSLDHLFLDREGVPTLVEVKRSTDGRIRREVVGQMLDYAANAVLYWPLDRIVEDFKATCEGRGEDPETVLATHLEGSDLEAEEFWDRVSTNLKAKRVRLLFVADEIPEELRRIVEFLNEQMSTSDVLAVEIKRYVSKDGLKTFVANVLGNTTTAVRAKDRNKEVGPKGKLYAQFWPPVMQDLHEKMPGWFSTARKTPTWFGLGLPSGRRGVWYSLQFTQSKNLQVRLVIQGDQAKGPHSTFERLLKQREEIEQRFGAPLEWHQAADVERRHIGVVRDGDADVERTDEWAAYRQWLVDTAVRFRDALQPAILKLGGTQAASDAAST